MATIVGGGLPRPNVSMVSTIADIVTAATVLLTYVAIALLFVAMHQVTVKLALWRIAIESLEITNFHVIERVKAQGNQSSPLGEGLADALNVGSF